jgi:hypothetical protein
MEKYKRFISPLSDSEIEDRKVELLKSLIELEKINTKY